MRWSAGVFVIGTVFGVGFDLILDHFGTRRIISESAPVLTALLPHIGIGLVCGAIVGVGVLLKKTDEHLADVMITDLDRFVKAGKEYVKWASRIEQALMQRSDFSPDEHELLRIENPAVMHRYIELGRKHFRILGVDVSSIYPSHIRDSMELAAKYAEMIRAHGYLKGRWLIFRDRKKNP